MHIMQSFFVGFLVLSTITAAPASTGSKSIRRKVIRVPVGQARSAPREPLSMSELAETLPIVAGKTRSLASAFDSDEESVCTSPIEPGKRVRFVDEASTVAPEDRILAQPVVLSGTAAAVALYQAVLSGDEAAVCGELERGVNVNELLQIQSASPSQVTFHGKASVTALHAAVKGKYFEILCLLLANGANPNLGELGNNTPFGLALDLELSSEFIIALIEAGADIDQPDLLTQFRPLEMAMMKGNRRLFLLLLERGAEVNFVNPNTGRSLIHQAMYTQQFLYAIDLAQHSKLDKNLLSNRNSVFEAYRQGEPEIMEMLLYSFGTDFPVDSVGWRPPSMKPMLHDAILTSKYDAIRLLIRFGALYVLPEVNFNALELALQCNERNVLVILASADEDQFEVALESASIGMGWIGWMVPSGKAAFIDHFVGLLKDSPRFSSRVSVEMVKAMFLAGKFELFGLIKTFVDKGLNIHARLTSDAIHSEAESPFEDGLSLLDYAAKYNSVKLASYLIEKHHFDPNETTPFCGRTSLHVAVFHRSHDVLRYLLSVGGNPDVAMYSKTYPPGFVGRRNYVFLVCLRVSELALGIDNGIATTLIHEHKKQEWGSNTKMIADC